MNQERSHQMATTFEQMQHALRTLVTNTPDVEGAATVSLDGLILTSVLPAGTDEDRVSAMAAALLSLGERTAEELQRGTLEQVYVKGDSGYIILMQAGPEAVLEVIAGKGAKLGMVLLDMKRVAQDMARLL
jgi:predicted regulator of Ras-like GTPase activity (Roadblock/LC7/MglB family)